MGCHWQCRTKGNSGWAVTVSVGLKETVAGLSLAECRTKGNSGWAVTVSVGLKETVAGLSLSD